MSDDDDVVVVDGIDFAVDGRNILGVDSSKVIFSKWIGVIS